ncbi:Alpha N-terminal protein methyltransferase 1 [Caenorhabditis elegans]|uniref:Alpha N-terminal protein methyltransferase 1 n=1 Tax=Caenorhabditis elegans TaxID=6239 RepID=NTM1_CAEEL|nr:Alpha N-terminal protein methyltransferase 1 [Caenorhabditis elegans]Q9N4D9.2 RecName: Full=Alpha N-terminal protein methyltransferase 1; AltName: Full=X-Pro-Lys N-terminal protein methyltransferase 1; Short=NTM1 [Caenorhabditis elegans]CCD68263.1 Alpha N-terminal protein methyltransferase 1 [Caenorhabditis elegans]|eukprot:NP_490660.1 Alpha N-terminal protein methyltransferase 1 [Caenorhabditis elegans]
MSSSSSSRIHNGEDVYEKAEEYWSRASQDVNGMLGGFEALHAPDISASKRFIEGLKKKNLFGYFDYALDCGAGIGRVTKHLLMPFFSKVDMEDVVEELITKSDQYIGKHPRIGDKFVEGLQTFAPPERRYDLIWIQWVSGHLVDEDLVDFFKRCAKGLKPGGCIVLKDNVTNHEKRLFDDDDHSWTRTEPELLKAFADSQLDMVSKALQTGFPKEIYPVKMYALKPQHTGFTNN